MIRVIALYPNQPGATFDHEYYNGTHRELVLARWGVMGLRRLEVDRGLGGLAGAPAPFLASAHLFFESMDALERALAAHGDEVMGDVPNFSSVQPIIQVSETVDA